MTSLRRISLITVIAAFSIAAVMGIAALLIGEFGDLQLRVLLTTVAVGLEAAAVLCYATPTQRRYVELGVAGFVVSLLPFFLGLTLIWNESFANDLTTDLLLTSMVVAATIAQICLLGGLTGNVDERTIWIVRATILVAILVALLLCWAILQDDSIGDWFWRSFGVLAILDALGTVVLIALGLSRGRHSVEHIEVDKHNRARLAAAAATTGSTPQQVLDDAIAAHLAKIAPAPVAPVPAGPAPVSPSEPESHSELSDDLGDGEPRVDG